MLTKQNKNTIDWTDHTWNPIAGCQHGCEYCYCNRLSKRYNKDFKKYEFREHYLKDLKSKKLKGGDKIFVGSSGDMWGDWVPKEHIQIILDEVKKYPQYIFQFLTKNPKRYNEFIFSDNCWLGCTYENNTEKENKRLKDFYDFISSYANHFKYGLDNKKGSIHFLSCEPLQNDIADNIYYQYFQWIIIGADSNIGSIKQNNLFADKIIANARKEEHSSIPIKIWVKNNYKYHSIIKEFPDAKPR